MSSDNVVLLEDPFRYIGNGENIIAVVWQKDGSQLSFGVNGTVAQFGEFPQPHELRQLMVMWMALCYPDNLAFDSLQDKQ